MVFSLLVKYHYIVWAKNYKFKFTKIHSTRWDLWLLSAAAPPAPCFHSTFLGSAAQQRITRFQLTFPGAIGIIAFPCNERLTGFVVVRQIFFPSLSCMGGPLWLFLVFGGILVVALRLWSLAFLKLITLHNFMAAADSAVVLLELNVQWD